MAKSWITDVYKYNYKTGKPEGEKLGTIQMIKYGDRLGTHNGYAVHENVTVFGPGLDSRITGTADHFNNGPIDVEAIYCISPYGGTPVIVCNLLHGLKARIREEKRNGTYQETKY